MKTQLAKKVVEIFYFIRGRLNFYNHKDIDHFKCNLMTTFEPSGVDSPN